ncbi:Aste57867_21911 [Aphanomyces stellatus]|uniref:Aste57867_21911 protein n=1 Tax=Aphanomyces stellatus TaxID=120398 RepID=A0A485LIS8_9STRA|nr:hypothetical protein As57867_021842 [Aphanomyces stellatus]VFT98579.1 Aste57867_21911 [Aphanomyces stellatus]
MSFSGFALKGKKKAAAPATKPLSGFRVEKERPDAKKDIVLGFSTSGDAVLKDPSAASGPLVIPCIKQNWTADEEAAEALLADIRASSSKAEDAEESTLVIPIAGGDTKTSDPSSSSTASKEAPLLSRNRIPGMENVAGDKNKFKHDLSMRPDELDIHSDAFDAVPIEEFGAALLRGMGWTGKDRVEPTGAKVQMRHYRLGLGATPKPVVEPAKKKKYIPKPEPRERTKRSRSRSRDRHQSSHRRR